MTELEELHYDFLKKRKESDEAELKYLKALEQTMDTGLDCPYDADIHGRFGTCNCNHENIDDCAGDI